MERGLARINQVAIQLRCSDFQLSMIQVFSLLRHTFPCGEKDFEAHTLFKRISSDILVHVALL